MSEISDMIQRLCPDGVEYRKLISVAKVQYGYPFDAKLFTDDDTYIPLIRIRDVKSGKSSTYYSGAIMSEYIIHNGDILVGMDGEFNLGRWKDRASLLNQRVCKIASLDSDIVLNGFLFHLLSPLFKKIEESITGSTVKHLSAKVINDIEIPVPPLEVQRKIVEILDNFSELTAELTAELEARRKQYEYYRDSLLNFSQITPPYPLKWMKLGDVASINRGIRVTKGDLSDKGFPVFQNCLTPMGYYHEYNCQENTPFVICGGAAGNVGYTFEKCWAADDCEYIMGEEEILNRYIYFFLMSKQDYLKSKVRKASIPRLSPQVIKDLLIPIPPLAEQERIVSILDRFEALTTDLTSGLPAEIKARQQQYEYYRDTLLSFPRKSSNS